jgi:hypothetical protein
MRRRRRSKRRENALRKERIDLLRDELIRVLGGRCATRGCATPFDCLEIDHVDGVTWKHSAAGRATRHIRYAEEYRRGVRLQLLCRSCNGAKNQHRLKPFQERFDAWLRGERVAA